MSEARPVDEPVSRRAIRLQVIPPSILQSRLAISLAFVAGFVNLVAVVTCGVVASHMTGHAGMLGRDIAEGALGPARFLAALLGAFVLGSFLAGLAIEFGHARRWSSIYALPAAIELVLLVAFGVGVELHDPAAPETGVRLWWMGVVATLAMGVQNATITRISRGVVRTTHLTGVLTDLGHECARLAVFRRLVAPVVPDEPAVLPRVTILGAIALSFIAGAAAGTVSFDLFPRLSMVPPIAFLAWIIVQDLRRPILGPVGELHEGVA